MVLLVQMVVLFKYCYFLEILSDFNMSFEVMLYFFGVIVMGLQYINFYRIVWWLLYSYVNYVLVIIIFNFLNLEFFIKMLLIVL